MSTQNYEGPLTMDQRMSAYRAVSQRFGLKANARDALDASPAYGAVMEAAYACDWERVAHLLKVTGINKPKFDADEIEMLVELVSVRISEIESGERTGFCQPVEDELADMNTLLAKVQAL